MPIFESIPESRNPHLNIPTSREYGVYTVSTVEDWTGILHLAERWGFEFIKALAIKHLAAIASDIDKVVLGRQYGIDRWLHEGLIDVYMREKSLTKEEGRRMTVVDFIEISAIRQLFPPPAQATPVIPHSLEEDYARYAPLYPSSSCNGSESAGPEAALAEDTNIAPHIASSTAGAVSHTGPCEAQSALILDSTSNPTSPMPVPIEGSAMLAGESSSEAKLKEAALPRADRATQRDATRHALSTLR